MWVNAPWYMFFFFFPLPGAKGACLCDMPLHGVGSWPASLGKEDRTGGKEAKAREGECVLWTRSKQSLHTFKDTNKHNYIGDIPQEDPIWLCVFVVVFGIAADSQFFMVAGLSVGAVKHSSVFSCDWDSLEEESVRHGAWLSVCWSSSGGMGRKWALEGGTVEPPSSSSCPFLSLLSYSFCPAALSSVLVFLLSSISQRGFISCDFAEAHYQFPTDLHPRPASQQQHTTTRTKPQEGRQLDWCLSKNPLLLTCVANPSHHVCCCYCKSLVVLYCAVLLAGYCFCSIPNNLQ